MIKKIFSRFLFFILFAILSESSVLLAVENDTLYEGWVWSPHLKVKFSETQELDFFNEHEKLSKIIKRDLKKYLESNDKKDRNVALISLSFIVKKGNEYSYKPTNIFDNFLFLSGETKTGRKVDFLELDKKKVENINLREIDPSDYPLKVKDIQQKGSERFRVDGKSHSSLDEKIYTKYGVEVEELISTPMPQTSVEAKEYFKKLIAVTDLIHYRSTHSEQKMFFFLEKSFKSIYP